MRISDWSSDVCSSDLQKGCAKLFRFIKLLEHRVALGEAGQRPTVGLRVHGIAGLHHPHRGGEFFHESIVNVRMDDHPLCTRSEEHTSELQSLMRISYAVFCLNKKNKKQYRTQK